MNKTLTTISTIAVTCLLAVSCEYKQLCMDHNHGANVTLAFDWSRCEHPQQRMSVECNTNDGLSRQRYSFEDCNGGSVRLQEGTWTALGWNENSSLMLSYEAGAGRSAERYPIASCRTSSLTEGTQISTRTQMPMASQAEGQRVLLHPDPIWSGLSGECRVPQMHRMTMEMHKRSTTIHITINHVTNLRYSGEFGAALSSLSSGLRLENGRQQGEAVTMAIPLEKQGTSTLTGTLECFGHSPETRNGAEHTIPHILTVYAMLGDGTKWYSSMDVTSQLHSAGDEPEIYLEINGLPLPKPIVNGSGFMPEVGEWQEVNIEIGME